METWCRRHAPVGLHEATTNAHTNACASDASDHPQLMMMLLFAAMSMGGTTVPCSGEFATATEENRAPTTISLQIRNPLSRSATQSSRNAKASLRRQWSPLLSKFSQATLPSGTTCAKAAAASHLEAAALPLRLGAGTLGRTTRKPSGRTRQCLQWPTPS